MNNNFQLIGFPGSGVQVHGRRSRAKHAPHTAADMLEVVPSAQRKGKDLFSAVQTPSPPRRKPRRSFDEIVASINDTLRAIDLLTDPGMTPFRPVQPRSTNPQVEVGPPPAEEQVYAETSDEPLAPTLPIDYSKSLSDEARRAGVTNIINLPEGLLKSVSRRVKRQSDDTAKFILRRVAPAVLSYAAASKMVSVALKDGFGITSELDDSVEILVEDMTRMDLMFHYLKQTQLPKTVKQEYMSTMIAESVKRTFLAIDVKGKSSGRLATGGMEGAVVRSRSSRNSETAPAKTLHGQPRKSLEEMVDAMRAEIAPQRGNSAGHMRSARHPTNSNRPLHGGF